MEKFKLGDKVRIIKLYETDKKYTKLSVGVEGIIVEVPTRGEIYGIEFNYLLVEGARFNLTKNGFGMFFDQFQLV